MVAKTTQHYLSQLGLQLNFGRRLRKTSGFSNFDEERILADFINKLLPADHNRTAVDIGAGDGVKASNTYALFLKGWRGLGVEGHRRRARRLAKAYRKFEEVEPVRSLVTPSNVVQLLRSHGIPTDFSVLSLDIDSYDYFVLDALLESFRPYLVVTEINEKIPPPIKFVVTYDPDFEPFHHFFGNSISSLEELCEKHGYAIIGLEYNNAFLAPSNLPGIQALSAEEAYRAGYLERTDRHEKFHRNYDMEALQTMSRSEGISFINDYFSSKKGKYVVG
jgi:hypothetical protein